MEAMSVDGVAFNVWWHWEKAGRDRYKTGAHTQCTRCGSSLSHCGERITLDYMRRHAAIHQGQTSATEVK